MEKIQIKFLTSKFMEHLTVIQQTIQELLGKMGLGANIDVDASDEKNIIVNISTTEAKFLIGRAGHVLEAFQHLVRVLVNKKIGVSLPFILDVNDYQKNRLEFLRELALQMADQSLSDKISVFLRPMTAYERRIVHLALSDHPQVETESVGDGVERRVVIKPKIADRDNVSAENCL